MTENSFPLFSAFFVRAVRENTVSARAISIVRKEKPALVKYPARPKTQKAKGKRISRNTAPCPRKGLRNSLYRIRLFSVLFLLLDARPALCRKTNGLLDAVVYPFQEISRLTMEQPANPVKVLQGNVFVLPQRLYDPLRQQLLSS